LPIVGGLDIHRKQITFGLEFARIADSARVAFSLGLTTPRAEQLVMSAFL
jgi:hypothetical protein